VNDAINVIVFVVLDICTVATLSRLLIIIGLFRRIQSLL